MGYDPSGRFWNVMAGAIIGCAINIATTCITVKATGADISTSDIVSAALSGAASGALAATGVGKVGQILGNAAIGFVSSFANEVSNYNASTFSLTESLKNVGVATFAGAASGFIGGKGAKAKGTDYRNAINYAGEVYRKVTTKTYSNANTPIKLINLATQRLKKSALSATKNASARFFAGSFLGNLLVSHSR